MPHQIFAAQRFTAPQWLSHLDPSTLVGALVYLAAFWIIGCVITALLSRSLDRLIQKRNLGLQDVTTLNFIKQFGKLMIWIFMIILYAHLIPTLDKFGTALLASVSIASIVIGLAAQNTLSNLISGVSIVLYRPFRIGDRIQVNTPNGVEMGTVENISLGYTTLLTFDHRRIVMANSQAASQTLVNLTSVDPSMMSIIPFGISYESDIQAARSVAIRLAEAHTRVTKVDSCPVTALNSSSVDMSLFVWCAHARDIKTVQFDILEQLKDELANVGVSIPYPHMQIKTDADS